MPDPSIDAAAWARATARLFVETAERRGFRWFDFSEDSVELLDDFADRLWDPTVQPSDAELDSLTKLMGSYLGQVLVRNSSIRWTWLPDRQLPALLIPPHEVAHVLDKAYKRQVNGRQDSLAAFYKDAKRRASNSAT